MAEHRTCRQPDRDVPQIVCGYPLSCPYHTVAIDPAAKSASVQGTATMTLFSGPASPRATRFERSLSNPAYQCAHCTAPADSLATLGAHIAAEHQPLWMRPPRRRAAARRRRPA